MIYVTESVFLTCHHALWRMKVSYTCGTPPPPESSWSSPTRFTDHAPTPPTLGRLTSILGSTLKDTLNPKIDRQRSSNFNKPWNMYYAFGHFFLIETAKLAKCPLPGKVPALLDLLGSPPRPHPCFCSRFCPGTKIDLAGVQVHLQSDSPVWGWQEKVWEMLRRGNKGGGR